MDRVRRVVYPKGTRLHRAATPKVRTGTENAL